jgi:homogentisate 1,2-dioxygenase
MTEIQKNPNLQIGLGLEITTKELYKRWKQGKLELSYTPGMQTDRVSECIEGAVPVGRNTPQKVAYGLYTEQLSGTSFTTPRVRNMRTWLYRILPSAKQGEYSLIDGGKLVTDFAKEEITPARLRWDPVPIPETKTLFYQGWHSICGAGSPEMKVGMGIHIAAWNESMFDSAMVNSDGDLLIVPQEGDLLIRTECGIMEVPVNYIAVIHRGIQFSVLVKGPSRAYIAEIYESHFTIPDLGPIGANGLANPRDFETPVASFENTSGKFTVVQKFLGKLFQCTKKRSVFDVVGWHGNYVPYRYDLRLFCAVNSVTFDHMDPSIFTVLTAQTANLGVAACDFVVFPPRWSVHTETFRPPYYHRNCMSEYMGNIYGQYEAKPEGFLPGGGSLHSCMAPHGPDAQAYEKGVTEAQEPVAPKTEAMAFMFESCYLLRVSKYALNPSLAQSDYYQCWDGLKANFVPPKSKL